MYNILNKECANVHSIKNMCSVQGSDYTVSAWNWSRSYRRSHNNEQICYFIPFVIVKYNWFCVWDASRGSERTTDVWKNNTALCHQVRQRLWYVRLWMSWFLIPESLVPLVQSPSHIMQVVTDCKLWLAGSEHVVQYVPSAKSQSSQVWPLLSRALIELHMRLRKQHWLS